MDRRIVDRWLAAYLRAWTSNAAADIEAVFTVEAIYLTTPWSRPIEGRPAIVEWWLRTRDEPGTWQFTGEPIAVDREVAIIRGETSYAATGSGPEGKDGAVYANLWLVQLAVDGRARRFEEWWIARPDRAA